MMFIRIKMCLSFLKKKARRSRAAWAFGRTEPSLQMDRTNWAGLLPVSDGPSTDSESEQNLPRSESVTGVHIRMIG